MKRNMETRDRILQSACEIFFEKGFLDSTVDDISVKAGISHGTFYIYFKNKREALLDLVNQAFLNIYKVTEDPWKKGHNYFSLEESIKGFLRMYSMNWKLIRTWKEVSYIDKEFAELWKKMTDTICSRVQQNIEYSIKRSLCRNVNAAIAAPALVGMVEHYAYLLHFSGVQYDLEEVSKTLADLWYHALYTTPPEK